MIDQGQRIAARLGRADEYAFESGAAGACRGHADLLDQELLGVGVCNARQGCEGTACGDRNEKKPHDPHLAFNEVAAAVLVGSI